MKDYVGLVALFCFIDITSFAMMSPLIISITQKDNWEIVHEGIFKSVEYGESSPRTVIHFEDGSTCVLTYLHNMPFPTGTRIKVLKNGNDEYKIVPLQSDRGIDGKEKEDEQK